MNSKVKALDGGWAWMVVVGGCIIFLHGGGFMKGFTVMYIYLLERFQESDLRTSIIFSIFMGMAYLPAPLASALVNKIGHKKAAMSGAVLLVIGTISSGYVPSISWLYVTLGVLTGFGFCLGSNTAVAITTIYFDKRRGIATSLITVAASVGGLYVLLISSLLSEYGFSGTMLIFCALSLNVLVAGMLFRPLEDNYPRSSMRCRQDKNLVEMDLQMKHFTENVDETNDYIEKPSISCDKIENLNEKDHFIKANTCTEKVDETGHRIEESSNLYDKGNLNEKGNFIKENICIKRVDEKSVQERKNSCSCKTKLISILKFMDISYFLFPSFILLSINICVAYYILYCLYICLFVMGKEKGFQEQELQIASILINVTDALAKILIGLLFDVKKVRKYIMETFTLILIVSYIALIIGKIATSKILMYFVWMVGIVGGAMAQSQQSHLMGGIVDKEHVTTGVGIIRGICGISLLSAPAIGGYLKDVTGVYSWLYLFTGIVGLLAAGSMLCYEIIRKLREGSKEEC